MRELDQQLLNFSFKKNYKKDDYYVSECNYFAYKLVETWPKWEKNIINICGEKFSGKSHLAEIFLKKNKGKLIDLKFDKLDDLTQLKVFENILLENFDDNYDEEIIFSLINFVDQNNKYLIIISQKPINEFKFLLKDLESRSRNCLIAKINKPDDQMIKVLLTKCFSDKQILIDNKLIDFTIKRISRSYGKIFEFIYNIDELSLKKKKSIDLKIIKDVLKAQIE